MYKDPDKQREANRQASQRRRDKGMTNQAIVIPDHPVPVIPEQADIPADKREQHCRYCGKELKYVDPFKPLPSGHPPTVTDICYGCAKDRGYLKPKRGKDIKCFEDLPPDVQETIDRMSLFNGKIDRAIKIKRTEAAIRYQYLFPGRFTGVA